MIQTDLVTEEIVIVGSRYGDYTDVLKPYYEKGEPIEPEDIKTLLGSNVVYLQPVHNSDDPYAVGVFITTEKRLGFVWKDQSPSLREVMSANNKRYYKAHIKRINTQYGLMMAEVKLPNRLADNVSRVIDIDEDWAKNIPETMTSITQQSLSLGFALLCDELPEAEAWNESLENRLANLKRNLPSDLSAQHIRESLELYDKMRQSDIKEVRESCDNMLDAYVSRGSEKKMKLWANQWLLTSSMRHPNRLTSFSKSKSGWIIFCSLVRNKVLLAVPFTPSVLMSMLMMVFAISITLSTLSPMPLSLMIRSSSL